MSRFEDKLQALGANEVVDLSSRTASSSKTKSTPTARTPQEDPRIKAAPGA